MPALILILLLLTVIGLVRATSLAVQQLRYRKGNVWYLGPDTKTYPPTEVWKHNPSEPISAKALRIWGVGGTLLLIAACLLWIPLGIPLLSIIVALFGVVLFVMVLEGIRTNRSLKPPSTPTIVAIVEQGLSGFSPKTDELIRMICASGGRPRLESEFDWRPSDAPPIPLQQFHARLEGILSEMPRTDADPA